ncbi:MAG TPA: hypothetical protein VHT05_09045, partial [Candidatus Elarobacter sp.]|nr:hypothetical protein [Candidatus Elarobacter sp.]
PAFLTALAGLAVAPASLLRHLVLDRILSPASKARLFDWMRRSAPACTHPRGRPARLDCRRQDRHDQHRWQ